MTSSVALALGGLFIGLMAFFVYLFWKSQIFSKQYRFGRLLFELIKPESKRQYQNLHSQANFSVFNFNPIDVISQAIHNVQTFIELQPIKVVLKTQGKIPMLNGEVSKFESAFALMLTKALLPLLMTNQKAELCIQLDASENQVNMVISNSLKRYYIQFEELNPLTDYFNAAEHWLMVGFEAAVNQDEHGIRISCQADKQRDKTPART